MKMALQSEIQQQTHIFHTVYNLSTLAVIWEGTVRVKVNLSQILKLNFRTSQYLLSQL